MNMYSNYLRNRIGQNELALSDLGLDFAIKTQDDKIKQSNLQTQNMQNQVDKSSIDLDIAKQTKDNQIKLSDLNLANAFETYKQNKFNTDKQGEIFDMNKKLNNAQISNIYSNIKERNQNIFLKDYAFKEQERAKQISAYFQAFRSNNPNLSDEEARYKITEQLTNDYNDTLKNPLLNDSERANKLGDIQSLMDNFHRYLPDTAQANSVINQGLGRYAKGDGDTSATNVLAQIGQANVMKEQLEKELDIKTRAISEMKKNKQGTQELEQEKAVIEQKLSQLQGVPNTANAKSLMNYFTDSLGKTAGEKTYNQMINYSQIKQDIRMVADAIDTVALYGWSGEGLNKLAHMFGVATNKDDINNKIIALLNNIQGDTGAKLKQQYENIVRLTPNTSAFGMNVKRMQQDLTNLNEHINININSILYPHKENAEVIKKSFNISTKPLEFKYDYEDYRKTNATPNNTLEMYRKMPYA